MISSVYGFISFIVKFNGFIYSSCFITYSENNSTSVENTLSGRNVMAFEDKSL